MYWCEVKFACINCVWCMCVSEFFVPHINSISVSSRPTLTECGVDDVRVCSVPICVAVCFRFVLRLIADVSCVVAVVWLVV